MSDIIDLIRTKLESATGLNPAVDAVLMEVRMEYAGDTVYIRQPRVRELMPANPAAKTRPSGVRAG